MAGCKRVVGPRLRPLTVFEVLEWADAHHLRTEEWPSTKSGVIVDAPTETWGRINWALSEGYRGFQPGGSVARLLMKYRNARNVRNVSHMPRLSIPQILAWADNYYERVGKWPTRTGCGSTLEPPFEQWLTIDSALSGGHRGLPRGSSLAGLLWEHRGVYNVGHMPRLTIKQILAWADEHHRRTGSWPKTGARGGRVLVDPRESWGAIGACLHMGLRGLPGGDSLANVLFRYRGVENQYTRPKLTVTQILKWARAHHQRTGKWPQAAHGYIRGTRDDTWMIIHEALSAGHRGLPGGITLAELLNQRYGVPIAGRPPKLKPREILAWADAHHARTGAWPRIQSGPIPESPGDTWVRVDVALRMGMRGRAGGSTLHRFLVKHRRGNVPTSARNKPPGAHIHWLKLPPLTLEQVLGWADDHHRRTGRWPNRGRGPTRDVAPDGTTWTAIDLALRKGGRGLPANSSMAQLLDQQRGVRNRCAAPRYTARDVLRWADAYFRRHGTWPRVGSGPIEEAPGETWAAIDHALQRGTRGLPGGYTIYRLLNANGRPQVRQPGRNDSG